MIESRKDLKDRLAALQQEVEDGEASLESLQAAHAGVQDELAAATQSLAAEQEAHADTKSELEDTKEHLEVASKALEESTAKLESFDEEVENAAAARSDAQLQSVGAGSLELEGNADPLESVDILEQAAAIDDPIESAKFYEENASSIREALFNK